MVKMNPDVIPTTEKVEQLTLNPLSNCIAGGDVLPSSSSNNIASTDFDRKVRGLIFETIAVKEITTTKMTRITVDIGGGR